MEPTDHESGSDESILVLSPSRRSVFSVPKPVVAEGVGVAVFVFVGTLVAQTESTDLLAVALAHGLTIAILITAFGSISGGHFNPAVTLGVLGTGAIKPMLALLYFVAQLVGAILGSALCWGVMSYKLTGASNRMAFDVLGGGVTELGPSVGPAQGVLCEAVLTFLLVLTVLMTDVNRSSRAPFAGFAIGLAITVDIAAGGAVSGASMNPARSFGPAVLMSCYDTTVWRHQYIYWLGPALGAIAASALYRLVFAD